MTNTSSVNCRSSTFGLIRKHSRSPRTLCIFSPMAIVSMSWFLILCLSLPLGIESETLGWNSTDDIIDLVRATLLITTDISKYTSTVVVAEGSLEPNTAAFNDLLLKHVLLELRETIAVQFYIADIDDEPWRYHVFIVDSAEAFRDQRKRFSVNYYERSFYFLIVLTKYTSDFDNVLEEIFQICYEFNVINVNVIIKLPLRGVSMFTYTLFSEHTCHVVQPQLHFVFNESLDRVSNVFPNKFTNFYGCPLKMTGRIIPPFLMFDGNSSDPKSEENWYNLYGVEGFLIKEIAGVLNFTIDLLPFPKGRSYIENGTAHGSYDELLSGRANFAIGSFSVSDDIRWIISPSVIYHSSPYIYVIRGIRSVEPFKRLLKPFHFWIWICIGVLLFIGTGIIQIVQSLGPVIRRFIFGQAYDAPLLNLVAIFLGYPIVRIPTGNFVRYLLLLWLLLSLILRNAFQGALYDSIRIDSFGERPTGFEDLIRYKYKILASDEIAQLVIYNKYQSSLIIVPSHSRRYEILGNTTEKLAAVSLKDNFLYYMTWAYRRDSNLFMLNEVVYIYHMVMYFPKHSIYLPAFDQKLKQLVYSGISRYITTYYFSQPSLFSKMRDQPLPKAVTYLRLKAVFDIYLVMISVALAVFGLELLSIYSRKLRRIFERIS